MQHLSHFAPLFVRNRANAKDPPYEEVAPPEKLRRYAADLSALGAFSKPNQLVANFVSRELARGEVQVPSYTPYIVADVSATPGLSLLLSTRWLSPNGRIIDRRSRLTLRKIPPFAPG